MQTIFAGQYFFTEVIVLKKSILIFISLAAFSAVLCGCSDMPSEPSFTSYSVESSAESSSEVSESSDTSAASSAAENPAESSQTQTSPEPKKSAAEMLEDYAKKLKTSGTQNFEGQDTLNGGKPLVWKLNKYKVDDFNKDGSPELVLQYYIGTSEQKSEQGVLLEILRYEKNELITYQKADDYSSYINTSSDKYIPHETVDELYIDENNRLAVLSTSVIEGESKTVSYDTYSIDKESFVQTDGLTVTKADYTGSVNVTDIVHSVYGLIDNIPYIYTFTAPGNAYSTNLNINTGLPLHAKMLSIKPVADFAVEDAAVHRMEKEEGFDTTQIPICDIEQAEDAFRTANENPPADEE